MVTKSAPTGKKENWDNLQLLLIVDYISMPSRQSVFFSKNHTKGVPADAWNYEKV
jgi:hypothetical protein